MCVKSCEGFFMNEGSRLKALLSTNPCFFMQAVKVCQKFGYYVNVTKRLFDNVRLFLIAKAKFAKVVRTVLDIVRDLLPWRTFLMNSYWEVI